MRKFSLGVGLDNSIYQLNKTQRIVFMEAVLRNQAQLEHWQDVNVIEMLGHNENHYIYGITGLKDNDMFGAGNLSVPRDLSKLAELIKSETLDKVPPK